MLTKLFTLSTFLGLLAALPTNAAEIEVVAGGPDGLIQYNLSEVSSERIGGPRLGSIGITRTYAPHQRNL